MASPDTLHATSAKFGQVDNAESVEAAFATEIDSVKSAGEGLAEVIKAIQIDAPTAPFQGVVASHTLPERTAALADRVAALRERADGVRPRMSVLKDRLIDVKVGIAEAEASSAVTLASDGVVAELADERPLPPPAAARRDQLRRHYEIIVGRLAEVMDDLEARERAVESAAAGASRKSPAASRAAAQPGGTIETSVLSRGPCATFRCRQRRRARHAEQQPRSSQQGIAGARLTHAVDICFAQCSAFGRQPIERRRRCQLDQAAPGWPPAQDRSPR